MRLPRAAAAAAAALAIRQQVHDLLPESYCTPQCPQCKEEIKTFNATVDCLSNSTFITNCGGCQTCVSMNAIESPGTPNAALIEADMVIVLNFCQNSPASAAVQAYQSQASKISQVGDQLASLALQTASSASPTITSAPAVTGDFNTNDPSWTTSPGAVAYLSELAASTSGAASTITPAPGFNTSTPSSNPPNGPSSLGHSWILGPVIGSVLGLATVVVVIMLTRRRHRLEELARATHEEEPPKEIQDDESSHSEQDKAQLHSEPMEAKELDNNEIPAPVEMPVPDPVCSELNTPREGTMDSESWPLQNLPVSPLPWMFAMVELRDKREERSRSSSPKHHDTFYHA